MSEEIQQVEVKSALSEAALLLRTTRDPEVVAVLIKDGPDDEWDDATDGIIVRRDELITAVETLCGKDGAR